MAKSSDLPEDGKRPFSSFRRKPESRGSNPFWTPASAGVTVLATFSDALTYISLNLSFDIRDSSFDILRFAFELLCKF